MLSCKKNWICNCTYVTTTSSPFPNSVSTSASTSSINDKKESDAKIICDESEKQGNNNNQPGISQNNSCELSPK